VNSATIQDHRSIFAQPAFQGRLIAWMVVLVTISSIFSAAVLYLLLNGGLESQLNDANLPLGQAHKTLIFSVVLGSSLGLIMAGVIVSLAMLYASRRLAGPLRRFRHLCQAIADGDLTGSVRLSKGDGLHDLAEAFEHMLESLRHQRVQQQQVVERVHMVLRQLRAEGMEAPGALEYLEAALLALAKSLRDRPST
jgi:nitrogen fixation/metabolism regulation signal transduction histidine kinase